MSAFYSVLSGQRETPGGVGLAKKERLPDVLVHLGAWILSEYAYLSEAHPISQILSVLSDLIEKPHTGTWPLFHFLCKSWGLNLTRFPFRWSFAGLVDNRHYETRRSVGHLPASHRRNRGAL